MKRRFLRRARTPASPPPRAPAPRAPAPEPAIPARRFDWRSLEAVAPDHERFVEPHTAPIVGELLALAGAGAGDRALDIGTGTGRSLEIVRTAVGHTGAVAGVDRWPRILAVGARARPGSPLAAADVLDLPFRDGAFDVVTANLALASFRKHETALFEMIRVLRQGGRLAVSAWEVAEDDLGRAWRQLVEEAVGREPLRDALREAEPWAEAAGDPARLEGMLRDAGLRPVTVRRHALRLEPGRDEYIAGRECEASGRFVRAMLGPALWDRFRARSRAVFAERFPDRLLDFRDVILAAGTKP